MVENNSLDDHEVWDLVVSHSPRIAGAAAPLHRFPGVGRSLCDLHPHPVSSSGYWRGCTAPGI